MKANTQSNVSTNTANQNKKNNGNIFDIFISGARKGWTIGTTSLLPNVIMAFVLSDFLKITGLQNILEKIFTPIMVIFGLPGDAIAILVTSWLSIGGGAGLAASYYSDEIINFNQLATILPAILLMGAQIQYMGRILGTIGIKSKYYGMMICLSILNACISMLIMRFIVTVFYSS